VGELSEKRPNSVKSACIDTSRDSRSTGTNEPIWTPLIPATMSPEEVKKFGQSVPMKRAGQPAELAAVYVMLASDDASYISGATVAVTGGKPLI
jgi:NAD(P)-dependent dehydrogenase (short-subunit alcohol dehydrogenase family)